MPTMPGRLLPVLLLTFAIWACSGDDEPEPPAADVAGSDSLGGDVEVLAEPPENAAGITGAVSFELPAPVGWLAANDSGPIWMVLQDGSVGFHDRKSYTEVTRLGASEGKIARVHPPPAVLPDGTVVLAEAVLDSDDCHDYGSVRWIDPATGLVTTRDMPEAPAFDFSVTPKGLLLLPIIEYDWSLYNEPPICLKGAPETIKIVGFDKEAGMLWWRDTERPAGPPTLLDDGRTAVFGDGARQLFAIDYEDNGKEVWSTTLGDEGVSHLSDPALGAGGDLYVNMGTHLVAMDGASGAEKWNEKVDSVDALSGEPVVASGDLIFVAGTRPGADLGRRKWALFAYDEGGNFVQWREVETDHLHSPTFGLSAVSMLADGQRVTLAPKGTGAQLITWLADGTTEAYDLFATPPTLLLGDGSLVAGWGDSRLIIAPVSETGLAATSWPRSKGSNRGDGRGPVQE